MENYKIRFTASATIGKIGELRTFLHYIMDHINLNGGSAVVHESGNWFEKNFVFEGKHLDETLANFTKRQFIALKRFSD